MLSVEKQSERMGLKINRDKTNVLTVHGTGVVKIGETELKSIEKFKYLGSHITPEEPSSCEIRIRLGHAKECHE